LNKRQWLIFLLTGVGFECSDDSEKKIEECCLKMVKRQGKVAQLEGALQGKTHAQNCI